MNFKHLRTISSQPVDHGKSVLESLQEPNHPKEKRQVLDAIGDLGYKVNAGKVSEKTGLPLLRVSALLNRIAYETRGQLLVDTAGGVTYSFAPNFQFNYIINGSKNVFRTVFRIGFNAFAFAIRMISLALFFVVRVSFGIMLVASVVLVVVLIVAAIAAIIMRFLGNSDGGGDSDLGDFTSEINFDWLGGIRYWVFDWLWDWVYWGSYFRWGWYDPWYRSPYDYSYWDVPYREPETTHTYKYADSQSSQDSGSEKVRDDSKGGNFLDNCFEFLFGSGDPNKGAEARRWSIAAQAIKAKSGIVIAEDMAPYVEANGKDENWMLPILIRFNGTPEVTDSGKLVYCFPAFMPEPVMTDSAEAKQSGQQQKAAASDELNNLYKSFLTRQHAHKVADANAHSLPLFIQEQPWSFANLNATETLSVIFFALLASGGAAGLMAFGHSLPFIAKLHGVLMVIAAYGAMFFVIPIMRLPWLMIVNAGIEKRNDVHALAAQKLASPDATLARHLQEADLVRSSVYSQGPVSVAYSTEEDLLEQEFKRKERNWSP